MGMSRLQAEQSQQRLLQPVTAPYSVVWTFSSWSETGTRVPEGRWKLVWFSRDLPPPLRCGLLRGSHSLLCPHTHIAQGVLQNSSEEI